jgi:proline iminopeptidase
MKKIFLLVAVCMAVAANAQSDSLFVTTSDSVKLFVKRSGAGAPVLVIHGGPGSNSYYLEKEGLDVLRKDAQLIYLDQRGCGRSDTATDYSLQRMLKDFEEVRQQLGYQQWLLLPHSFGGIMATAYAAQYPQALLGMIYLNCTVNINHSAKSGIQKTVELLPLKDAEKAYLQNDSIPLLDRWGNAFWQLRQHDMAYALMFDKKEAYKWDSALINQPFLKFHFGSKVWHYPEYFADFSTKTAAITVPVLIITGTRDYTIGPDHATLMRFPNKKIIAIAGGHALYLEQNQALYIAIRPFLKRFSKKA